MLSGVVNTADGKMMKAGKLLTQCDIDFIDNICSTVAGCGMVIENNATLLVLIIRTDDCDG